MSKLDLIVDFVEGKISTDDFQRYLHTDKELEDILSEDAKILPYTKDSNIYIYLLQIDFQSPGGRLNSQEALCKFLDAKGIAHTKDETRKRIFSILLRAQPRWLDIPEFYLKEIFPPDMDRKQDEIISYAKNKIGEKFTFIDKPPKWLQSPRWMFKNGHPLTFIGQIDIGKIRHDETQLYIFYDDRSKEFFTLEQSA
jgi:hypothetical protein